LYYVNKAIAIDGENPLYWKRFAAVNCALHLFEEAEYGYRKSFECGDVNLDTFTLWTDVLQFLGEFETAIEILLEATNLFPEAYEIEYRLAGLYYLTNESIKGNFHLNNGLRLNFVNRTVLKDCFPVVWERKEIQQQIAKFKN
jgi:tetratricopeptide (TPR) repeat protein